MKRPKKSAQSFKTGKKPTVRKKIRRAKSRPVWPSAVEFLALSSSATIATLLALGYFSHHFAGNDFYKNLLPFSAGIVGLVIGLALSLLLWSRLRIRLAKFSTKLPSLLALSFCAAFAWLIIDGNYLPEFKHFRTLIGGKQLANSETLAHQVYAAYRRYDSDQLSTMMRRAEVFSPAIKDAAKQFDLNPQLLMGLAATESSFIPRDSQDGGHGLFQITAVPNSIMQRARQQFGNSPINLNDPRQNALIAAATLKFYLAEMNNDVYLGLLAYNIGPRNGGLRFIMQQYGATDFVSMQPYLQTLPRDYPIRVLSQALAFKIWQQDGKLLAYQEGHNASHIQAIGIPGLETSY